MDQLKLLKEFTAKTGAEQAVGRKLLQEHSWSVEKASRAYTMMMHTAALPPAGPRKNAVANQPPPPPPTSKSETISPTNTLEGRKLKRGLSKTTDNMVLVTKARESVLNDIIETSTDEQHFVDTPEYTFILPDLTKFPEDFRAYLQKDLIETATLVSLEQAGRLNWWADMGVCNRLLPLATTGDGNCLLHAASLGMWGFHDRQLTLRQALFHTLSSDLVKSSFWRRWRWHQTQINKQSGLILTEKEWTTEWTNLLKLASTVPRSHAGSHASCCDSPATNGLMEREERGPGEPTEFFYESLEEFHVFVLAHVLRRPIIVVADTVLKNCSGEALAPIPFGGIYLPLESSPDKCHRAPLLLTYDAAHFSALVPMETDCGDGKNATKATAAIPVVDPELRLLPIHFLVDPGSQFVWNEDELNASKVRELLPSDTRRLEIVQSYLDLTQITMSQDVQDVVNGRPRSNSWSGPKEALLNRSMSIESSESGYSGSSNNINGHTNGIANNGEAKLDKNGDKKKVKTAKQMHSVVKSFGSIGKTMSKKLKNLGGMKYANKLEEKRCKPGSVTQSTNTTGAAAGGLQQVMCARLRHKRLDYQEEMVENYLKAARDGFHQDRTQRQARDAELKKTAERRQQEQNAPVPCISPQCKQQGSAAQSYLCKQCYNEQRKEALTLEQGRGDEVDSRPASSADLHRQNTLVDLGSSKFYTYADEDHSLPEADSGKNRDSSHTSDKYQDASNNVLPQTNLNNMSITRDKVWKAPLELSRSSFYDESQTSQARPVIAPQPGTAARIVNNLEADRLLMEAFQAGDRNRTLDPPPSNPVNTVASQKRPNVYTPKVQNVAQDCEKSADKGSGLSNCRSQYVVNSSNVSGQYVSRIEVGTSPSAELPPKQPCRSDGCRNIGLEDKEYYCGQCYSQYDRNRTTFL